MSKQNEAIVCVNFSSIPFPFFISFEIHSYPLGSGMSELSGSSLSSQHGPGHLENLGFTSRDIAPFFVKPKLQKFVPNCLAKFVREKVEFMLSSVDGAILEGSRAFDSLYIDII